MFTVYNEEESRFQLVEEPDPSLSHTYADYHKWKFEEQVELIRGRIYKISPAPAPGHQQVSINLSSDIHSYLKKKKCRVFAAPFDVRLPVKNKKKDHEITTVVQPDICVICHEPKIDGCGCLGGPDLLIEILSTGNTEKEVKLKFQLSEEARVKEYWVVYTGEEDIAIFILNEKGKYDGAKKYAGKDRIKSNAVKGLTIKLDDIFFS